MTKEPRKSAPSTTTSNRPSTSHASRISSPAATGGAGLFFEQHVDAYWLAQLLVRGIPPILHDCVVVEVHLQTEHLGWHTDDFLIVGQNGQGDLRKLAGQVKRTFTVSATDDECKKAMQDFWQDFKNPRLFSPNNDRFTLVTLRGTNTLLEHFSGLLDCARSARDGLEFESRLTTPGVVSRKATEYCHEIRTIISENEGESISVPDIWPFLRVLHVLSLDLNSSTRQSEAVIKTLLAHTANEQDALGAAEASWNALLSTVSEGMPEARSFRWNDLPEAIRKRHSPIGAAEQRALVTLRDHSALILDGIHSTIGNDLHLSRDRLVQLVIDKIESTQVVLISGSAGSGKSGIAKDVVRILAEDHFVFSFRAEEFASPHLDDTLQRSQIPSNARMLGAVLAGQARKILLVESVERLLESSTRDAFTDLLTLVARDESWRLVLTCRSYSADLVRTGLLEASKVRQSVVTVPLLDDSELHEVEVAYPALAYPLANAALRQILRTPYVLDKALQIQWADKKLLPQSEREFRLLFWQEIVRVDHRNTAGMPYRREETFVQVALRRAQALTLYAPCGDLDSEVADALRRDSLITTAPQSAILVAPAHDVLEDWAILRWIDEQYAKHADSVRDLSVVLGTYPAIRRTYRKWVSELVEREPGMADDLFEAVIHGNSLAAQFRDDTLISLLRSSSSVAFLERHHIELFANDKRLLRQVVHLLQVACVTTPDWLETTEVHASLFNVPEGVAWACVLRLVQSKLEMFTEEEGALLLRFIENWARGVTWQSPYPDGAESVAAIAHWLLAGFDDYGWKDNRQRTLQVIAKIPNADRVRFAALLQGSQDDKKRNYKVEDFRAIIFGGLEGMPAVRDMPEIVVSAANDYFLYSEEDLRQERGYMSDWRLETTFGIKSSRSYGFSPASAYHGPFLPLLRYHPREGLAFIIAVFNHSADWYAHPRVRLEIEPPFEMALTFTDGTRQTQWCNARLWNLYRGTSVGPDVLQSLLMALERWLLEFAETHSRDLDAILMRILKQSKSAALTAVVASVATAFPHASSETLLVLLRSPVCIRLDRLRLVHESQSPFRLSEIIPQLNARNKIYEDERKEADARPHHRRDLETAIANLQLGAFASRVHEILDSHRAETPPIEEQDEEDRIWRLALHRMDLRQYTVDEEVAEVTVDHDVPTPSQGDQQYVRLALKDPEPDVKEMTDQTAARLQTTNAKLALLMWGVKVFGDEESTMYDPAQWRPRLQEARIASERNSSPNENDLRQGGPGFVAAVCVRDHWEELSADEREWCLSIVCYEVELNGNQWNRHARVQRNNMSPDRACAYVLPILLGKTLTEAQRLQVLQTFVIALTHAIDEVRGHAVWGIGRNLWAIDRDMALRCVNALATEAKLVQEAVDAQSNRTHTERRQIDEIEAESAASVREQFFEISAIADNSYQTMDPTTWFGAEANGRILTILGQAPAEPMAIAAFERLTRTMVGWWDADNHRHRNHNERRRERNYELEGMLRSLLESYLLRVPEATAANILEPILDAVDRHPREIHWLLLGLISVEDRKPSTPQFWSLWEMFANRIRRAKWLARIDDEHANGQEMISALFLVTWWKEEVRHWRSLEGHAWHIHSLFEDLPASSLVLDDYVRFLYHVGEQSLPEAFIRVAKRLQQRDPRQMLKEGNTVFMLEALLQRYVYGRPLELKRQGNLREAVLILLDLLVENGSSAAFRMRDDFVTPIPIT